MNYIFLLSSLIFLSSFLYKININLYKNLYVIVAKIDLRKRLLPTNLKVYYFPLFSFRYLKISAIFWLPVSWLGKNLSWELDQDPPPSPFVKSTDDLMSIEPLSA